MTTERVDDIPLIYAELQKSNLADLLTEQIPDHGNWQGVSSGTVAAIFLTYVLSCADHRTSHVEQWAAQRIHTLRACTGHCELRAKDLTDDRLGILLDKYADKAKWDQFEAAHNQRLIEVYDLDLENNPIRLDAMITQSHREAQGDFQLGYSKQHRADLPQMKTMLATVDPFAVPLHSLTVAGNEADDGLYLPLIEQLDRNLPIKGHLFVGDSKMSSTENRSGIAALGHYYLTPLSKTQCSSAELDAYLANQPKELHILRSADKDEGGTIKAKAFETQTEESNADGTYTWIERRIVVFSPNYAQSKIEKLERSMARAQAALDALFEPKQGKRRPKTGEEAQQKINQILKEHKVAGLIEVKITETHTEKQVRAYGSRPAQTRTVIDWGLSYQINEALLQKRRESLGWRAYGCNAPAEKLTTLDAVQCYRSEYRIEHKFDELLNRVTALMPVYLTKPNRIKALIRLLLLALKFVSLIEMQARTALAEEKQTIKGLYPGNPARATEQPTAKMILKAFEYITLVAVPVGDSMVVKLTKLKPLQIKILQLLNINVDAYLKLEQIVFSNEDFSET
jgi:transposase